MVEVEDLPLWFFTSPPLPPVGWTVVTTAPELVVLDTALVPTGSAFVVATAGTDVAPGLMMNSLCTSDNQQWIYTDMLVLPKFAKRGKRGQQSTLRMG